MIHLSVQLPTMYFLKLVEWGTRMHETCYGGEMQVRLRKTENRFKPQRKPLSQHAT